MVEPTEYSLLNWKIWLAFPSMKFFMQVFANRTFTQYHDDLDGMVTSNGITLRLNDPAIDAFLDLLPFLFSDDYTFCRISMAIGRMPASSYSFSKFEDHLPALQRLSDLRASGGWANLDELFMAGWSKTFSSFVDEREFLHQPEDPGLGGPDCYRVKLLCSSDPNEFTLAIDTFPVASSVDHLIGLIKRIVAGEFPMQLRNKPEIVTKIDVIHADNVVLTIPVSHSPSSEGQSTASSPMAVDWANCSILSANQAFVKAFAAWAPDELGGRLKGRFLEESLGL